MKKIFWLLLLVLALAGGFYFVFVQDSDEVGDTADSYSMTEPDFEAEPTGALVPDVYVGAPAKYTMSELQNWERPPGPLRVGIQVGHWQNQAMPEELENLERNTGATWGGLTESEVNLVISELLKEQLEVAGIEVDLLPATVPPGYVADVFLAIHADGNPNEQINGFKFSAPRRDYAGTSQALVDIMYDTYADATGLRIDPSVTRRMTAYYAFNWPRYEYAIHPFTPAVIVETGFLTSPVDRAVLIDQPERAARGISTAVVQFLQTDTIPRQPLPTPLTPQPDLPITGTIACAPLRAERLANADRYDCVPSIADSTGAVFLLVNYSSSTLPVGSTFTADGEYLPIQNLGTYFWFPYQVNGMIADPSLPLIDYWWRR